MDKAAIDEAPLVARGLEARQLAMTGQMPP